MKFYISYFYHVRHFPSDMLPISINSGEPNWYHDFKDRKHCFKDKRGVWNGGYIEELSSSNLDISDPEICKNCQRIKLAGGNCPFMQAFRQKLDKLDFNRTINKLEATAKHFDCSSICFVVYEKPDVKCGERWPFVEWFKDHGIAIEEFSTNIVY